MNITLKKASILSEQLRPLLNELNVPVSYLVQVNSPEVVRSDFETASIKSHKEAIQYIELLSAQYELRKVLAKGNSSAGVVHLLTEIKEQESFLYFYNSFSGNSAYSESRLQALMSTSEETRNTRGGSYVGLYTQEELDKFEQSKVQCRRNLAELKDKLLQINVTTTVTISENTVTTLKELGLI